MDDLIEALNIFSKYMTQEQLKFPTWCTHDELNICCDDAGMLRKDILRLEELGFHTCDGGFESFRFGSC